jgi:hypothetical protein
MAPWQFGAESEICYKGLAASSDASETDAL